MPISKLLNLTIIRRITFLACYLQCKHGFEIGWETTQYC